jgi:predicted lipid carrier protein YhbT
MDAQCTRARGEIPARGARAGNDHPAAILRAVATAAEVERSLRVLMDRLKEAEVEPGSVPERSIVCAVPDLGAAYRSRITNGRFNGLKSVQPDAEADVRISARSDDLIALIDGRLNIGFAFLTGKIRVDASPSDLMMIRRLF